MKSFLSIPLLGAAVLAGSALALSAGDVTGKVTLKGTPKAEIPIPLTPACGKINTTSPTTRHYVVAKDGGLANVFVYIKDAKKAEAKGPEPVIDQMGCMYEPYVLGVVAGQKFKIKSSDAEMHNVHATPNNNAEFNFVQLKGQENDKVFDKAEILARIKCDVHPWMFAYVGVVDHPYFAVTDKDGNFKISGLPDGKYQIEAFHLKTHVAAKVGIVKTIEVKGDTKQDFTVELAP
jgi:plastocyanin